jgi:hypothetical protein
MKQVFTVLLLIVAAINVSAQKKYKITAINICKCICSYDVTLKNTGSKIHVLFADMPAKKGDILIYKQGKYYFKDEIITTDCFAKLKIKNDK